MLLWLMNLGFAAGEAEAVVITGVWGSRTFNNHTLLLTNEEE